MSVSSALSRHWTWLSLYFFVDVSSASLIRSGKQGSLGMQLDAAGLVALADLTTIAQRTVLTGSASFIDIFFLSPGIHRQQAASESNGGELPATAALTSGYVFRIENQATVSYLQMIGRSGHLVNVSVKPDPAYSDDAGIGSKIKGFFVNPSLASALLYLIGPVLTIASLTLMVLMQDWWGLGIILMLMVSRLCNVIVIRRRSRLGWTGASEPGVSGDLLVLLSQDRWIRIRGLVDDLKAVTAGQWLQETSKAEGFVVAASTLLVFVMAALAGNTSGNGSLILLCLLLTSAGVLGLSNSMANALRMHGRVVRAEGEPKAYNRRLDLVDELIKETGRDDWATSLGMIVAVRDVNKVIL